MSTLGPVKQEGLSLLTPLEPLIKGLTITDEDSYLQADQLLGRIRTSKARWLLRIGKILDPARVVYDEARALRDEVAKPLEKYEQLVKAEMLAFKREEQRLIAESRLYAEREAQRLADEAEALEKKKAAARTKPMVSRIAAKLQANTAAQEAIEQKPEPVIARGVSSGTRTILKVRVRDSMQLLRALVEGETPIDVLDLQLDTAYLTQMLKENRAAVESWPGLEVYEDIRIVGR